MPRAGQLKPVSDRRLPDLVSIGLLARTFPPGLVDEVIASSGRVQQRVRSLPARVVVYFVIGLALFSDGSYDDVFASLTDGLSWLSSWRESFKAPSGSAIFQARRRLGWEAVRALFVRVARPLATSSVSSAFLAGRRLVAIDGTMLDVADTLVNDEFFGRPGVNKGERSAFPQARVVGLVECGTHAIFAAVTGVCSTGEVTLARELLPSLEPGMLCLADRGFYGFKLWEAARQTGADLLWRIKANQRLDPIEVFADGSFLAHIFEISNFKRRGPGIVVRVVEYSIDDGRTNDIEYRLITTMLDPEEVSATEMAVAYSQRWEIENAFDELKTHQRGPRIVLRSKSPDLVRQEIWGHLCCHYAIRAVMWEAAIHAGTDPDRVSFVAALRIARRSIAQPGDFPPSGN